MVKTEVKFRNLAHAIKNSIGKVCYFVIIEAKVGKLVYTVKNSIRKFSYVVVIGVQPHKSVEIHEAVVWQFDQTIVRNSDLCQCSQSTE